MDAYVIHSRCLNFAGDDRFIYPLSLRDRTVTNAYEGINELAVQKHCYAQIFSFLDCSGGKFNEVVLPLLQCY